MCGVVLLIVFIAVAAALIKDARLANAASKTKLEWESFRWTELLNLTYALRPMAWAPAGAWHHLGPPRILR